MIPYPLHPALIHFPLVLGLLLPVIAVATLWAIRRGAGAARAWSIMVAAAVALAAGSWVAVETGEREEERVERVVPAGALERHEEAGERSLLLSGLLAALTATGLLGGRVGRTARLGATIGALALAGAAVQVGHSGGDLVYRHGAASVYTAGPGAASAGELTAAKRDD